MCYCVVVAWLSRGLINALDTPETFGSPRGSVAGVPKVVLGGCLRGEMVSPEWGLRQFRPRYLVESQKAAINRTHELYLTTYTT